MIQIKLFETEIEANLWLKEHSEEYRIIDIQLTFSHLMIVYEIKEQSEKIKTSNNNFNFNKLQHKPGIDPLPQMD